MSETVRYKGTLKRVPNPENLTADGLIRQLFLKSEISFEGFSKPCFDLNDQDCISDFLLYNDLIEYDGHLYKKDFTEGYLAPDHFIIISEADDAGYLEFNTVFHNGGTCLDEMLRGGLKEFYNNK